MTDERLYSDEEVAEVLSRALQPITTSALPARRASGITLAELEAAAVEAGIDGSRVRAVALSLGDSSSLGERSLLLGPHPTHLFDRVIEGEVPRERMSDVVGIIRRETRVTGTVTEVGDWLEWTSDAKTIHITVTPEGGKTKIQFIGQAGPKLVGSFAPVGLATLIALVTLGDAGSLTLGLGAAILGGAYATGRLLWEFTGSRAARKYRGMIDQLTAEVSRLVDRDALPPQTAVHADPEGSTVSR